MVQSNTILEIADNSGAKYGRCIKVLGGSGRKYAGIGDIIVIAIIAALPGMKVKKGDIARAVVVSTAHPESRLDGSLIRFDKNSVILVNKEFEPIGTRILYPVSRRLREMKKFMKIISLAPEVL